MFTQNFAFNGGAITNHGSNHTITNSRFLDNETSGQGGAIYNTASSAPTITDSVFSGNESKGGGAVSNRESSTPSFLRCEFIRNRAVATRGDGGIGGAIYNLNSAPTFQECSFTLNRGDTSGGALGFDSSWVSVINCSFDQNVAGLWKSRIWSNRAAVIFSCQ